MDKIQFDVKKEEGDIGVIIELDPSSCIECLDGFGISITKVSEFLPNVVHGLINVGNLSALSNSSMILKIWKDEKVNTMDMSDFCVDPQLNEALPLLGIDEIHEMGYLGKDIVVGIADTGIDDTHPDLIGRVLKRGHTIGNNDDDNYGHGTACASCVGGNGEVYKGVAPECSFISVKVLSDNGGGTLTSVMNGIEWLMRDDLHNPPVNIISLSLGASMIVTDGSDPLSQLCAVAVQRGKLVVAAAGNAGPKSGSICVPGCRKEVIALGACDKYDRLCSFSSRGPTSDRRIKPDIVAPGRDIIMARAEGTSMGHPIDDKYTRASGTSFSTPIIAGLLAILKQKDHTLTQERAMNVLMNTAKKITS